MYPFQTSSSSELHFPLLHSKNAGEFKFRFTEKFQCQFFLFLHFLNHESSKSKIEMNLPSQLSTLRGKKKILT